MTPFYFIYAMRCRIAALGSSRELRGSGLQLIISFFSGTTWKGVFIFSLPILELTFSYSPDLSSFVDQPDAITHVAIVSLKSGVFVDKINYLLIL